MTTVRDLAKSMLEKSRDNAQRQVHQGLANIGASSERELAGLLEGRRVSASYLQHVAYLAEWIGKHTAFCEALDLLNVEETG